MLNNIKKLNIFLDYEQEYDLAKNNINNLQDIEETAVEFAADRARDYNLFNFPTELGRLDAQVSALSELVEVDDVFINSLCCDQVSKDIFVQQIDDLFLDLDSLHQSWVPFLQDDSGLDILNIVGDTSSFYFLSQDNNYKKIIAYLGSYSNNSDYGQLKPIVELGKSKFAKLLDSYPFVTFHAPLLKSCGVFFTIQAIRNNVNIHDFCGLLEFINIATLEFEYLKNIHGGLKCNFLINFNTCTLILPDYLSEIVNSIGKLPEIIPSINDLPKAPDIAKVNQIINDLLYQNRLLLLKIPIFGKLIFKSVSFICQPDSILNLGGFTERVVNTTINYSVQVGIFFNLFKGISLIDINVLNTSSGPVDSTSGYFLNLTMKKFLIGGIIISCMLKYFYS